MFKFITRWLDSETEHKLAETEVANKIDWLRAIPFLAMHAACLLVFWVGFSWVAFAVALGLYFFRIFAITAFYHRYFSHRSFKTNRFWQFMFGLAGTSATQRGPIWWASHHRLHHQVSDQPEDPHSPVQHGFWWSHMGWLMSHKHFGYDKSKVKDWLRYPELVLLNRFDIFVPIALAVALYFLGVLLANVAPGLGTNGPQMLVWGFFVSTTFLFHATVSINSLTHVFGKRRFETTDDSRNNFWLALLTFGEGWHNNHHHYPVSTRMGFRWWEIDISYYLLKMMQMLGIVWDFNPVPKEMLTDKPKPAVAEEVDIEAEPELMS